jgi:hypothetical protein
MASHLDAKRAGDAHFHGDDLKCGETSRSVPGFGAFADHFLGVGFAAALANFTAMVSSWRIASSSSSGEKEVLGDVEVCLVEVAATRLVGRAIDEFGEFLYRFFLGGRGRPKSVSRQ